MKEHRICPTVFMGLGNMGSESISATIQQIKDKFETIPWIFGFITINSVEQNNSLEFAVQMGNGSISKKII